jgi:large subunit ribosomal protein L22
MSSENPKIVKAKISFIRQTARKMRRTVNLIRNMKAGEAVKNLEFLPYAAARPVSKLIKSAIANAKHNFEVENPENLEISQILVDDKSILKRWRAMNKGRAYSIYKRTCQISLVLSDMKASDYAAFVWKTSPRNKLNRKTKQKEEVQA